MYQEMKEGDEKIRMSLTANQIATWICGVNLFFLNLFIMKHMGNTWIARPTRQRTC